MLTAPGLSWFRFVVFLPVLVLLVRRRAWWTAAWLVTAVALIGPLNTLLKIYFGRVRPDFAEGGARLESLSYPSGHSSGIATLVTVALVLAWPLMAARARHWALAAGVALVAARRPDPHVAGRPLPVRRRRRLGAGPGLGPADGAAVRGLRRGPGDPAAAVVSALDQRIVLAPTDGSLGPLLRIADDRLAAGAGYGRHEHRDVDVVAVVLAGSLRHRWGDGADLAAGDVAVLRAGSGLTHDEIAGDDGARVLQCYLRSAEPGAPPSYEVHRAADGLGRPAPSRRAAVAGAGRGRGRRSTSRRAARRPGRRTASSSSSRTAGRSPSRARCWSGSSTPDGPPGRTTDPA